MRAERRGERSSSSVNPSAAQTASWIAVSVGGSARSAADPPAGSSARRTNGIDSSSLSSDETASAGHGALEHPHVVGDPCRDLPQHRGVGEVALGVGGEAPQQRDPRAQVRSLELDQAPRKRSRSRSAICESASQAVAGQHDLLSRSVEGVEGVDELLLGPLLSLEHLDIVDQQRVERAVARLEQLRPSRRRAPTNSLVNRSAVV